MSLILYHHPFSRAANVVWMLEELEAEYELRHVDITSGGQKTPEILSLNPMGKLPILVDGDAVVTESAAIALYLADRYAYGRLAPRVEDPARGTYLRWSFFAPSIAASIASCSPHPACPGLKLQPASLAIAPGSITEGAKNDHRRYVPRAGSSTRGASRP